jgi:hypothetical protein
MALLPLPANVTLAETTLGITYFLIWQAVAITIEDFLIWLGKKLGIRPEFVSQHLQPQI